MGESMKRKLILMFVLCISTVLGLAGCEHKEKKAVNTAKTDNVTAAPTDIVESSIPKEKSALNVTFSKTSGVYEKEFDLGITCDSAAEIYYTTDGSNPITSATKKKYSVPVKVADRSKDKNYLSAVDPILFDAAHNSVKGNGFESMVSAPADQAVDKCTVIRAVAKDTKGLYTDVITNTYFIGAMAEHIKGIKESCKAAGTNLAVISLSMNSKDLFDPKTGIYVKGDIFEKSLKDYRSTGDEMTGETARKLDANYKQKGKEWERKVHMDFFESDGSNTSCELQQDCGIRIQGNYSRSDLQKGFRLYARKSYGKADFDYAVFGDDLKNDSDETITKFKTLTLRNGGNCAFTTKYSDTYWQSLIKDMNCDTQTSRPCVVYVDGEYWGLYVLQEDYSQDYFADTHGVKKDDVVLYKGDAEAIKIGYKLDLGSLPEGVSDDSYYFKDLLDFFNTHEDLSKDADYREFGKLVDIKSARDYFAVQIWINNKWDWPGKNWSLWKTAKVDSSNPNADGRWRYCFYDVEFGGVSGAQDASVNTIKEDNYMPSGLLDKDTDNPAVLIYGYLMTNQNFRNEFATHLKALSSNNFNKEKAAAALTKFRDIYSPLYDQFFERFPGTGSADNSNNGQYASYQCIKDFLEQREDYIQPMLDFVKEYYN